MYSRDSWAKISGCMKWEKPTEFACVQSDCEFSFGIGTLFVGGRDSLKNCYRGIS